MYVLDTSDKMFLRIKDKYNQTKAREICMSYGDDWDLPDCQSHKNHLERRLLNSTNIKDVWTSIEKGKHEAWLWVNGSKCKFRIFYLSDTWESGFIAKV